MRDVPGRHDSKGAFQEVWALTLALYRSESSCPARQRPTAPLIVLRAKVHHCSLQSDRRVPFEEVCPIATILTADADTEGINSTIRRLRRSAE